MNASCAAAHKRASVRLSAKSRKTCAECRSVLMCNKDSRLSAITQTSLWTRSTALKPINKTKIPLMTSKEATARSRFLWARCRSIFVEGGRMRRNRSTFSRTNRGAKFVYDLSGSPDSRRMLIYVEGDRTHAGVPAASISLTNFGEVDDGFLRSPGV